MYENLTNVGLWKLFLHIEMRISPILACKIFTCQVFDLLVIFLWTLYSLHCIVLGMELLGIQVDVKKLKEMAEILKVSQITN